MPSFAEVYQQIGQMAEARQDTWDDDAWKIVEFLKGEVQELEDQLNESAVTGEVTPLGFEIADVLNFTLRLCLHLGFDPVDLLVAKNHRNAMKYPDFLMQKNGRTPGETVKVAKESWKGMGGDQRFSQIYLDHLAHVEETA